MRPHALHPGAIQGKEGIKFCHLATLSRFGSSLTVANGQLVVGCPRYKGGLVTEVGAVFVYDDVRAKAASRVITAPETKFGLFGHSVASNAAVLAASAVRGVASNTLNAPGVVHVFRNWN